ncbi:MAG TPA: AsmA family protein [Caulobacteraceae bacterium]
MQKPLTTLPGEESRAPEQPPARRPSSGFSPRARWISAIVGAIVLAVVIFLLLFQWNWLRGPLANAISHRLHRPVSITGNLEVHPWSWSPRATVNGLVIGNPAWNGPAPMARLPRLTVQVKIWPLLRGRVILPLVEADAPDVSLVRDASGRANWNFSNNPHPKPLKLPPINHFIIADGQLRFSDARRKMNFVGTVSSNERVVGAGRGTFHLEGKGVLNSAPFTAVITGGPLANVDPNRPYPFDAHIQAGATRVAIAGNIAHPFDFGRLSGKVQLSGPDLSDLYHLTGLTLPNTPPYDLAAGFGRSGAVYAFQRLHGRLGDSDLAGSLSVDDSTGRPFLRAQLASRRLRLVDLYAVLGGAPKHVAGHTLSPMQKIVSAKLNAEHRLLPNTHLDVSRMRGMDARVAYRAESVDAGHAPIRSLTLKASLDHGVLNVDPVTMTLPQGAFTGIIRLDARRAVPTEVMDLRLSGARVENLFPGKTGFPPVEGGLYARARLTSTGDSVRAAAANANGSFTVVIPGGEMRKAFAELLGINGKGLLLLLGKSQSETPIRCAVADFHASNGILNAQRLVIDTDPVLSTGTGWIDLRDETLNLRLAGKPKRFQLLRLMAPITVKGSLQAPRFGADVGKAIGQLAVGGLLAAVVSPLALMLPFVSPPLAHNADCSALMAESGGGGAMARAKR